jgi:hypothetical protein
MRGFDGDLDQVMGPGPLFIKIFARAQKSACRAKLLSKPVHKREYVARVVDIVRGSDDEIFAFDC